MKRRITMAAAAAMAAMIAAGPLAAAPAYALPTPSPSGPWPAPGKDVKDPQAAKPLPITGEAVSLQPDAGRKPLVVVESGQEKGGQSYTIPADLLFDKDSATLGSGASANIDSVVKKLQDAQVTGVVQIIGHTDDTGDTKHNLDLSKRRAKAVNDAMAAKLRTSGITLKYSGVGEAGPLVPNKSEANRKRNRRVAIIYKTPTTGSPTDSLDFSIPLTQSVTRPADAPAGALASAERTVKLNTDTQYTLRMDILGLHRQGKLLCLITQITLVNQNGSTDFTDIGRVYSGTEDSDHEDDAREVLFDPAAKQELTPLITGKGNFVANQGYSDKLSPGGVRQGYEYFPQPTTSATKLSFYVPMFGTFDDIPIK